MIQHEVSPHFFVSEPVYAALSNQEPVVALESTVITHGLPYPQNRQLALDMEAEVTRWGAVPATIALYKGQVLVGIDEQILEDLAQGKDVHKISSRDIGTAIAGRWSGGTTVAATLFAAYSAGIKVFATGGIGGVHRLPPGQPAAQTWDISADLPQLAHTPLILVCAGAKAILDLPATLEYLETCSVPVVGFGTDDFPAFYSRSSGLKTSAQANSPQEIVELAKAHWGIGMDSAVLVANPPPQEAALPVDFVEQAVQQALADAERLQVRGQAVSPYLLGRMSELTHGSSLAANLSLLTNNARLAAQVAVALAQGV
jgi:pseudouridine-5'-phosphate glycosidase